MGDYRSEYRGKELRSAVSIVNKIIAIRKYPGNELRSFLIIEGSSDEKLYGQYIFTLNGAKSQLPITKLMLLR